MPAPAEQLTAVLSANVKHMLPELANTLVDRGYDVFSNGGSLQVIRAAGVEVYGTEELAEFDPTAQREKHAMQLAYLMGEPKDALRSRGDRPVDFVFVHPRSDQDTGGRRMLVEAALGGRIVGSYPGEVPGLRRDLEFGFSQASIDARAAKILLKYGEFLREVGNQREVSYLNARSTR